MTGYRDDRETLLRRIDSLEEEVRDARADDESAADDLASLRAERTRLKSALKHVDQSTEDSERARRALESELAELKAELAHRPTSRTERVAWAGVSGTLVLALMAALSMPGALVVVAAVAFAIAFGLYAVSLRNVPNPPPSSAPRTSRNKRNLRARVEVDQRREEARMSSKRRSRKQRRRRR